MNLTQNQLVNRIDTFESTGSGSCKVCGNVRDEISSNISQDDNQDDDEFRVTQSLLYFGVLIQENGPLP